MVRNSIAEVRLSDGAKVKCPPTTVVITVVIGLFIIILLRCSILSSKLSHPSLLASFTHTATPPGIVRKVSSAPAASATCSPAPGSFSQDGRRRHLAVVLSFGSGAWAMEAFCSLCRMRATTIAPGSGRRRLSTPSSTQRPLKLRRIGAPGTRCVRCLWLIWKLVTAIALRRWISCLVGVGMLASPLAVGLRAQGSAV